MYLPVLFFLAALCSAQDLSSSARDLARKIGRQDVANLTVRNSSSLSDAEAAEVKRAIESELRVRPRPEGSTVNVTLSENIAAYLWVAETQRGDDRDVVMLTVARPSAAASERAPVTIEKRLLWEQDRPILDAAVAGSTLVVLEPAGVFFYREGQLISSAQIQSPRPTPRDPRGRLELINDSFRAILPGSICGGVVGSPAIHCLESSGSGLAAGRNYFSEPPLPPYFSTAALPDARVIAAVDGRAHVYDGSQREIGAIEGWGSDIAAVDSGCGSGRQVLASKPGEPDAVQAYEVSGGRAAPMGDPAPLPGPVSALWSTGRQAVAVARNTETGKYAAYSLAITCSR